MVRKPTGAYLLSYDVCFEQRPCAQDYERNSSSSTVRRANDGRFDEIEESAEALKHDASERSLQRRSDGSCQIFGVSIWR